MNILIINHYAGSPVHGMEFRPYYLGREWVRLGHQVTIVAASCSHVRSHQPRCQSSLAEEDLDGIKYLWLATPNYSGNGIRRAFNIIAFALQLFRHRKQIIRLARPELVIASSTHPLDAAPGRAIARECGARFVFEVHDLWPLSPIELGGISPANPFMMLLQWAENSAYRHADAVVSMLPNAEPHMRSHGLRPNKFVYIPNGIEAESWNSDGEALSDPHGSVLKREKEEGRTLVGYAGAHGIANALDSVVQAAGLLRESPVTFVLVGQGPEKERLCQLAKALGLNNIEFLPPVPKSQVPALLSSMDVLLISLQRNPIFRFGISPNKLIDYMMAGKPIIQAIDAGNDMVSESGCGLTVRPQDPEAIADAIKEIAQLSRSQRSEMGDRGHRYALANHDYRVLARRFLELTVPLIEATAEPSLQRA